MRHTHGAQCFSACVILSFVSPNPRLLLFVFLPLIPLSLPAVAAARLHNIVSVERWYASSPAAARIFPLERQRDVVFLLPPSTGVPYAPA